MRAERVCLMVVLLPALYACAGSSSQVSGEPVAARPQWQCDPDAKGTDWQCIQTTDPVGHDWKPRPRQVPAPAAKVTPTAAPTDPPSNAAAATLAGAEQPASPDTPQASSPDEDASWLDLPDDFYVVQLLALSDKDALQALAQQLHTPNLAAAAVASRGQIFYVLLLGAYPDQAAAERAIASRPPQLRHFNPWIRSVGSLKDAVRQAMTLAAASTAAR